MTEPTPNDAKLSGFQDLTKGYQRSVRPRSSDSIQGVTCVHCGGHIIYGTLNPIHQKKLPYNCLNCVLIGEFDVIQEAK